MKKEKSKTFDDEILKKIEATPEEQRTSRQKKILKTNQLVQILTGVSWVGCVLGVLGISLLVVLSKYSSSEETRLKETYKEGLEEYKVQQIHELNEQFNDGEGFSSDEYMVKLNEFNNNYMENYFNNAASQEAKMDYQQSKSNRDDMFAAGASTGFGASICGLAAAVAAETFAKRRDENLFDEYFARETKGKGKDL